MHNKGMELVGFGFGFGFGFEPDGMAEWLRRETSEPGVRGSIPAQVTTME